jgi:fluoroacetyl-CoA thioesterase
VVVQARLIEVVGRRLRFDLQAHDGIDLISSGSHERCIVDRASFDARAARKLACADSPK